MNQIKMYYYSFFAMIVTLFLFGGVKAESSVQKGTGSRPAKVAFIGNVTESEFETKVLPFYRGTAKCENCEIKNLTPYKESKPSGSATSEKVVDRDKLWEAILKVPSEYSIVYLQWNEPWTTQNNGLVDQLNQKLNHDLVLVGYAGEPLVASDPTVPLIKTVLGQLHQALIVGELTNRERLLPKLFWGPEMITAIKPPQEFLEQGLSPLLFVSTLAKKIHLRKIQDWPDHLRRKKSKNKKLWPDINDLF
jgi:hypothetical protein